MHKVWLKLIDVNPSYHLQTDIQQTEGQTDKCPDGHTNGQHENIIFRHYRLIAHGVLKPKQLHLRGSNNLQTLWRCYDTDLTLLTRTKCPLIALTYDHIYISRAIGECHQSCMSGKDWSAGASAQTVQNLCSPFQTSAFPWLCIGPSANTLIKMIRCVCQSEKMPDTTRAFFYLF